MFRNLRDDPRWADVLRRVDGSPEPLAAGDLELDIPPVILAAVEPGPEGPAE